MAELTILNESGSEAGSAPVPAILEGDAVHTAAMHQVVVAHLANRRQGDAKTKTRGEVQGSSRKMFRQKGLGRARMGDIRSPIRVHGGTIFGPQPRSYRQKTPRKMKKLALVSAMRDKLQNNAVIVLEAFPNGDETPKTKRVVQLLNAVGAGGRKALIVLPEPNEWVLKSARNLPKVGVTQSALIHAYEILTHEVLITSPEGLAALGARLGDQAVEEAS